MGQSGFVGQTLSHRPLPCSVLFASNIDWTRVTFSIFTWVRNADSTVWFSCFLLWLTYFTVKMNSTILHCKDFPLYVHEEIEWLILAPCFQLRFARSIGKNWVADKPVRIWLFSFLYIFFYIQLLYFSYVIIVIQ